MPRLSIVLLIFATHVGAVRAADAGQQKARPAQPPQAAPRAPQAPARRPQGDVARDKRQARTGTASVSGRVKAAGSGAPLRQVEIVLSSLSLGAQRRVLTDAQGQYRFTDLPSGRYWARAARPGFVTLRYGAADPLGSGTPIDVAEGSGVANIDFMLPRAAVIAGEVVDEFGEPVLDAEVRAMRYRNEAGQRRLVTASRVRMTDDLGGFRIFGLLPGTYYISAVPRWRDPVTEQNQDTEDSYAATYFPGTVDLGQARQVTVAVGETVSGISFSLASIRTVRVQGTVLDSQGRPASGAQVSAVRREAGNAFATAAEAHARSDGTFELPNLAPGPYSIQAWVRGTTDAPPEFGAVTMQAADADVDDLMLRTESGGTLRGRIVLHSEPGLAAFKPSLIEITARPAAQDVRVPVGSGSRTRVRDDWTFELRGLSGARQLAIAGQPAPWALESIRLSGTDLTDNPIETKPGSVTSGVEIALTTRTTEIDGTVADLQPADGAVSVVVFPADRALWTSASRRVQIRRAGADGRFGIRGLPPGDYLAVAVPFIWQGEWSDPEFLERASASASRFSLSAVEHKALRLKLSPVQH